MLSNVFGTTGAFNPTFSVAATPVNSLGSGVLTVNGANTSLQFDPVAISLGTSPTDATGTLQVNNNQVLNSTLNLTGVAPATAPSGNIVGIFAGPISGAGGMSTRETGRSPAKQLRRRHDIRLTTIAWFGIGSNSRFFAGEHCRIGQDFHVDEPWDSEHNLLLLDRLPNIFKHPGSLDRRMFPCFWTKMFYDV